MLYVGFLNNINYDKKIVDHFDELPSMRFSESISDYIAGETHPDYKSSLECSKPVNCQSID